MSARVLGQLDRLQGEVEVPGWDAIYWLAVGELSLLPLSVVFLFLVIYVNEITKHYHINMRRIISFYLSLCILTDFTRAMQIVYFLTYSEETDYAIQDVFVRISEVRLVFLCSSLFANPGVVLERFFATRLINDYEKKSRSYIHAFIILGILLVAILMTYFYIQGISTIAVFVIFSSVNLMSVLVNRKLYRINVKFYDASLYTRDYSLQYRFQISENLKATRLWTEVEAVIFLSNLLCLISLTADIFEPQGMWRNISETFFNYCSLVYNFAIPFIILKHTNAWKKFFRFRKIAPQVFRSNYRTPKVSIVDTMGRHLETDAKTDDYYSRLQHQWENDSPKTEGRRPTVLPKV